jgi:ribosomal protein S18 acetylase RimI-like enzyme
VDNGSEVLVRAALPADAEAIATVHVTGWRESYAGILSEEAIGRITLERRALNWYRILTESPPQAEVFVAERNGAVVGFVAAGKGRTADIPADGEIHGLYIVRAGQRLGIGRALMRAAATALGAAGYRSAYLWVLRDNGPARAFYERLGGTLVAERVHEVAGSPQPEVAYLWPDLRVLIQGR